MFELTNYPQREQLDAALAEQVAQCLRAAVADKGHASIAVSGGSTPKNFFKLLSLQTLPWSQVTITLADERWVAADSDASNTKLVKENLCQHQASAASFFELKRDGELSHETLVTLNEQAQGLLPFDVLILGMGEDGHTASLFPCSAEIDQALTVEGQALMAVQPTTAPHQRITFTCTALKASKTIFLHLCGGNKKTVLEQAVAGRDEREMPIRAFLHDEQLKTHVLWAE